MEDLPFGTRGGIAVHSYFPLDAEYEIQVELDGGGGFGGPPSQPTSSKSPWMASGSNW